MRRFTTTFLASIVLVSCVSAPEKIASRQEPDQSAEKVSPETPVAPEAAAEMKAPVAEVAVEPDAKPSPAAVETPQLVDERVPAGWQFGIQAYTFRNFSFFQTVERTAALELKYVEMYPGQRIGGDVPGSTGHGMNTEARAAVKEKLDANGMALSAYGVVNSVGEKGWRQIFEFAKDMRIGTVIIEPSENQLDIVSKLCDEYGVNAAIHNHAKPTSYWDPEVVKAACEGRSARLGACPDVGHWTRSGLDTREALEVLKGHVLAVHLKDVKNGQYVPLGEGDARVAGVMAGLKRQGFVGPASIEHEGDARNPYMPVRHGSRFVTENALKSVEDLEAGKVLKGSVAADVSEVWKALDPGDDGLWRTIEDDDTSAYADLTDFSQGEVSAPNEGFPKEHYTCAFDNTSQTKYCVELPAVWVQYAFAAGEKHEAVAYSIRTANDAPDRDPKDWKLLGSNDGETYDVLDERSGEEFKKRFHKRVFEIAKPGRYNIYKLDITRNKDEADTTQLSEIELLIKKADAPAGMLPPEVEVPLASHPTSTDWPGLFKDDLSDSIAPDGVWTFDDGVLTASKDEAIWSGKSYDNFIVDLEFKTAEGTNSGVIVYCSDIGSWIPNSIEVQIADDHSDKWSGGHPNTKCGAFYGHKGATKSVVKKPGEWNRYTVTCKDHMIYVMLNGEAVNEMDMRKWTSANKNPDGSDIPSWLSKPVASLPTNGHIGLQGKHAGAPIYFRNLRIKAIR